MSCSDSGMSRPSSISPARTPGLDALDEHAVLGADLGVERERLLDPRLVGVLGDEVVEEAVRPLGATRDDRADGEVRPSRHDVDHGAGEEEVELAALDLAGRVVGAARLRRGGVVLRHARALVSRR